MEANTSVHKCAELTSTAVVPKIKALSAPTKAIRLKIRGSLVALRAAISGTVATKIMAACPEGMVL